MNSTFFSSESPRVVSVRSNPFFQNMGKPKVPARGRRWHQSATCQRALNSDRRFLQIQSDQINPNIPQINQSLNAEDAL